VEEEEEEEASMYVIDFNYNRRVDMT